MTRILPTITALVMIGGAIALGSFADLANADDTLRTPASAGDSGQPPDHDDNDAGHAHDKPHDERAVGKTSHGPAEGTDGHGHQDEGHAEGVKLSPEQLREFGIGVGTAEPGALDVFIDLPAEIAFNGDRLAHVTPRVPGVVIKVDKSLGDPVRADERLALMQSRELAEAKADYLADRERLTLARAIFERESGLWRAKVTSEQEYLQAKQALAEAEIEKRSSEQKLHALGFDDAYIERLPRQPEAELTIVPLRAPFQGVVVERHATLGERIGEDTAAFVVADLSSVWLNISIYPKDLGRVTVGQKVSVALPDGSPAIGQIRFIAPNVGEETRTARALAVLDNTGGRLRPGSFVTARIAVDSQTARVRVPKTALQTHEGETVVFVAADEGFVPRPIKTGSSDGDFVEIVDGLQKGERYAQTGAFTLKAQLAKASFGDGHAH
ncbi:efflux RND transporter periplasmic adaptor subunit [Defluviicoccus vanus]|uniref:Efflux RND transporter periplasmic adaptor subunit n=1 Tax=Defluviicoccus vanus TaxID=111831 RepID=A0A7H1N700_9PROT|nr:efflux RND transporter periplasmic adaptor subunit [Defluviicoccus vanus]QNT71486.1 efflux RND transporter periplasmic adaptor subunit [Defluviicoccus vanus]